VKIIRGTSTSVVPVLPEGWTPTAGADPLGESNRLIGAPVSRQDGRTAVRGENLFAGEHRMDRMVYAAIRHSTIARGLITDLDVTAAETAHGVILVMTYRNAPRMQPTPAVFSGPTGFAGGEAPIMQDNTIHWNGEAVAVVLAETQEQADYAASLVAVTYQESAPRTFITAKAHARTPDHLFFQPVRSSVGDAETALAHARHAVDETYLTPYQNHNAIELHALTVDWTGDNVVVCDATQSVKLHAATMAHALGIDPNRIHLQSSYVGGAFGGKMVWSHSILAAAASRLAGRPVRLTLSRKGVYRLVGGRTNTEQRVAIGADSDGHFTSLIHTGFSSITPTNYVAEPFTFPARHMYATDNLLTDQRVVDIDMVANAFMRAPGEAVGTFALESAIDELAVSLGMDPIELRLRNEPDRDPSSGKPFSSRHHVEAWRRGAERFRWEPTSQPGLRRDGEWLVGTGCASATYPHQRFPGGAARLTLDRDGCATLELAASDMGMGTRTTQMMITADRMALPLEAVTVLYGDASYPGTFQAGASSQTVTIAGAVIAAHRNLVSELLALAGEGSPLSGANVDDVGALDGGLCLLANPEKWQSYASILRRAGRDHLTAVGVAATPDELSAYSIHSYGAVFCAVRVNAVTGETRVERVVGSYDCGRIINPRTAASQLRGGIIMGLGLALLEETVVDKRSGRILNPSLSDYHVPVHLDVPQIDVLWSDHPDPLAPVGARGVGEIGITGVAAAVANAVYSATGRRVRELPVTLDKLI